MARQQKKENANSSAVALRRTLPHNLEAEDAVLGAFLTDADIMADNLAGLSEDDFYSPANRTVFECMKDLAAKSMPVDIVTVTGKLEREEKLADAGGLERLEELADTLPSAANCEYYIGILKRDSLMRRIIGTCGKVIDNAFSLDDAQKALAVAEASIYEIGTENQKGELVPISGPAIEVIDRLSEVYKTKKPATGLMSHYRNLDRMTNGFMPGQMIIIAARPGCGKTSFAMSIATNIAKYSPEKVVAAFNLEMSSQELVQRILVSLTGIDNSTLIKGEETQDELQKLFEAQRQLSESRLFIDDTASQTAEEIMSKCRRLKAKQKRLDLVIIDYLQLMSPSKNRDGNRQQEVADTSRFIKMMAKELKVPVIVLSQMSRDIEKREDKTPMLADLRESGSIEQDADMVFFLNNADGENEDTVEKKNVSLIIAKHRNGATGTIYYVFDKKHMRFSVAVNKKQADNAAPSADGSPENVGDIAKSLNEEEEYYAEEEYAPVGEPDDYYPEGAPEDAPVGEPDDYGFAELNDSVDFVPPPDEE